ncbi:acyclic terpene utilization AtuA family protein [Marinobacterium rhizophilum]|uniref:DUF1446 domain-containing protein n=1 Tax=Marinobacterium rhizophilum TaxID=420402 RepID=A0ABY5HJG3_9GAMM|nr:acyclic terpene utilization AtuA family protein [Marinobacterium rhizophilum]UTW11996.1 DUF1446 domain-containing protein [Marinobacterium rhizophilum]
MPDINIHSLNLYINTNYSFKQYNRSWFNRVIQSMGLRTMKTRLMVGGGAGFAGDRMDAAIAVAQDLATQEGPRYLIFETLAERTLALSQDPAARAEREQMMLRRLSTVLTICLDAGIPIIGNFGSWNPQETAGKIEALSAQLGCRKPRVAVVTGDDLMQEHGSEGLLALTSDRTLKDGEHLIAANAYTGAFPIAQALDQGADIVVTGRVADPALVLGPMISTFGLQETDWSGLACGTLAGHLIECGSHICGGYFADPGFKDVPGLAWVGFPIVEITDTFECLIRKAANTGGCVNERTVVEQLLYEIHDPEAYLTPDVVLDISKVTINDLGDDRVLVSNAKGKPRPDLLKATLCFDSGWIGEAEISYAGPNAAARARLAIEVIRTRAAVLYKDLPLRCDLIGVISAFASQGGVQWEQPAALAPTVADATTQDVRVRIATLAPQRSRVEDLLGELEALYTTGPAGGGGVRSRIHKQITTTSAGIPRHFVSSQVQLFNHESGGY